MAEAGSEMNDCGLLQCCAAARRVQTQTPYRSTDLARLLSRPGFIARSAGPESVSATKE